MSTAATDPQDRREQAKPTVSERQREETVLHLLFRRGAQLPAKSDSA